MTQTAEPATGLVAGARSAVTETWRPLASVFRNSALRKLLLATLASLVGDWAYATAVAVFAYGVGGAKAVGFYFTVRLTLKAVGAPLVSTIADRLPRQAVMVACSLIRFGLVSAAVVCLYGGLPAWSVFLFAALESLVSSTFRPAQNAWMPSLADSAEELTAANGTASTFESVSFFVGPAIGAFMLSFTGVAAVFILNALTFLLSAALVAAIRPRPGALVPEPGRPTGEVDPEDRSGGFVRQTADGLRAVTGDRDIVMVSSMLCAQSFIAGASYVFNVVLAVQILDAGSRGVGFIDSAFGVGAIVGGFVAIGRARKRRLASDMSVGVVLWSIPLVALWLWPVPAMVFVVAVLMGFGNPLVDVNVATILQRITPDDVMARVFGVVEGASMAAMALGALAMPFLIQSLGLGLALALLGLAVTLSVVPWVRRVRRLDGGLVVPPAVPLLRSISIFRPLTPATIENLAHRLVPLAVSAGSVIVREGEHSDRFYVIESGEVSVTRHGELIRHEDAGDFFGEIGLLRDVPRTATVVADVDTVLQVLERDDFLAAVTGQSDARVAADAIVSRRIAI